MILSYCRVSTSEQGAEGTTSLTEQARKNKAVAFVRTPNIYDFAEYIDKGVPGSIPLKDRPAGGRMLADAQPGDLIIATKLDRLFRSAIDALQTLDELKKRKVDVILIDIGYEPITGSGVAKLFLTMLAAFAEFERTRIAERITEGKKAKLEKGGHTGGEAPYGYRIVGRGRESRLEVNPDEQAMIRLAKDLWKQNRLGPAAVCREFEKRGLRDRSGSPFRTWQMQKMVKKQELAI